ncbi:hypothetical protein [Neptuniibacter sp. QD37_11]|uniref:hypothetical protein n=1 Tax=Neptuniibacter sp. QD37_11 TaxID=3398209 RepID=UPI0039F5AF94
MTQTTEFTKQLIVNASLNPSITLDEILAHFEDKEIAQAAWYIAVELSHTFNLTTPTHEEILDNPKGQMRSLWVLWTGVKLARKQQEQGVQFSEGVKLAECLAGLQAPPQGHTLEFYPHQALGYLSKQDAWNNFDPKLLSRVIHKIEELGIRSDFGENNPNTGCEIITWANNRDYWYLRLEKCCDQTVESILALDTTIYTILREAKPEVIRLEGMQKDDRHVTYVLWWD